MEEMIAKLAAMVGTLADLAGGLDDVADLVQQYLIRLNATDAGILCVLYVVSYIAFLRMDVSAGKAIVASLVSSVALLFLIGRIFSGNSSLP